MQIITCLNCRTRFRGWYCPCCGQKATTGRLGWATLGDDLLYGFTSMDRGFLFTLRELFTRPGHMMRDYLAGRRVGRYRPFAMLMILAGLSLLLNLLVFPTDRAGEPPPDRPAREEPATPTETTGVDDSVHIPPFVKTLLDHPATLSFLFLFASAWIARGVFGKNGGRRYNYIEYLFVGAYMTSQRFVVDLVLLPYGLIPESAGWPGRDLLVGLAYVGLTAWDYRQFFELRWRKAIPKTIWLMILSCVVIAGAAVVMIVMIVGRKYVASVLNG